MFQECKHKDRLMHAITNMEQEIDQLKGECLLLADVLRDAFEVIKTIEGEDTDESDGLTSLCLSIAHALALYDDQRDTRKPFAQVITRKTWKHI